MLEVIMLSALLGCLIGAFITTLFDFFGTDGKLNVFLEDNDEDSSLSLELNKNLHFITLKKFVKLRVDKHVNDRKPLSRK